MGVLERVMLMSDVMLSLVANEVERIIEVESNEEGIRAINQH
jgi:hypothetical protein